MLVCEAFDHEIHVHVMQTHVSCQIVHFCHTRLHKYYKGERQVKVGVDLSEKQIRMALLMVLILYARKCIKLFMLSTCKLV